MLLSKGELTITLDASSAYRLPHFQLMIARHWGRFFLGPSPLTGRPGLIKGELTITLDASSAYRLPHFQLMIARLCGWVGCRRDTYSVYSLKQVEPAKFGRCLLCGGRWRARSATGAGGVAPHFETQWRRRTVGSQRCRWVASAYHYRAFIARRSVVTVRGLWPELRAGWGRGRWPAWNAMADIPFQPPPGIRQTAWL